MKGKNRTYNKRVLIDSGYDILEYYAVIRKYLTWKYGISGENLELMYYLYCKKVFTRKDFQFFPLRWGNNRVNDLMDADMIAPLVANSKGNRAFILTRKAKIMVQKAHKLLSGEEKMPTNVLTNKAFRRDATYSMKKTRGIMKEMRELVTEKFDPNPSDSTSS